MTGRISNNPFEENLLGGSDDPNDTMNIIIEDEQHVRRMVDGDLEEHIARERNNDIRRIQREMKNINEIYTDITLHVAEQSDLIENIDSNIHVTNAQIVEGVNEMENTLRYQRRRTKINMILIFISFVLLGTICLIAYLMWDGTLGNT